MKGIYLASTITSRSEKENSPRENPIAIGQVYGGGCLPVKKGGPPAIRIDETASIREKKSKKEEVSKVFLPLNPKKCKLKTASPTDPHSVRANNTE